MDLTVGAIKATIFHCHLTPYLNIYGKPYEKLNLTLIEILPGSMVQC